MPAHHPRNPVEIVSVRVLCRLHLRPVSHLANLEHRSPTFAEYNIDLKERHVRVFDDNSSTTELFWPRDSLSNSHGPCQHNTESLMSMQRVCRERGPVSYIRILYPTPVSYLVLPRSITITSILIVSPRRYQPPTL